jgi:hypothetical protein
MASHWSNVANASVNVVPWLAMTPLIAWVE